MPAMCASDEHKRWADYEEDVLAAVGSDADDVTNSTRATSVDEEPSPKKGGASHAQRWADVEDDDDDEEVDEDEAWSAPKDVSDGWVTVGHKKAKKQSGQARTLPPPQQQKSITRRVGPAWRRGTETCSGQQKRPPQQPPKASTAPRYSGKEVTPPRAAKVDQQRPWSRPNEADNHHENDIKAKVDQQRPWSRPNEVDSSVSSKHMARTFAHSDHGYQKGSYGGRSGRAGNSDDNSRAASKEGGNVHSRRSQGNGGSTFASATVESVRSARVPNVARASAEADDDWRRR